MSNVKRHTAGRRWGIGCWAAAVLVIFSCELPAQAQMVLASVNEAEILAAEVDLILAALPPAEISAAAAAAQREAAREVAICRALVVEYLEQRSLGATPDEVQLRFDRWRKRLAELGTHEEAHFRETGWTEPAIRRYFAWQIGWNRYRHRQLNEDNLQRFFDQRRRYFDGTRLKVAHLLLRPDENGGDDPLQQARQLYQQIESEEITFADAVRQYSAGTTAETGGEIGWITADGPMDEAFTSAALLLEPGQLSPPTRSPFGVHLIRCLDVEPGQKQLADVREKLRRAAERHLFHRLSRTQAKTAKIQRTSAD